ncbi:UNVERIFIED_CONTAM: hypothetical protein HDU68_004096, partial [Siphonaria sp. JEL0065]
EELMKEQSLNIEQQRQKTSTTTDSQSTDQSHSDQQARNQTESQKSTNVQSDSTESSYTVSDSFQGSVANTTDLSTEESFKKGGGMGLENVIAKVYVPMWQVTAVGNNTNSAKNSTDTSSNTAHSNSAALKSTNSTTNTDSRETDQTQSSSSTDTTAKSQKHDESTALSTSNTTIKSMREARTSSNTKSKSSNQSTTIDERTESGTTNEEITSTIHDLATRREDFENVSKSITDTRRNETFEDTRHSKTDTVRDTKTITDSQMLRDTTSQAKEKITERTDSRVKETGRLNEKGMRQESKIETNDIVTQSEHESTLFEERSVQQQTAVNEHTSTRTAGQSQREWESNTTTTGVRTEKEIREQEILSTESAQELERNKRREVETVESAVKEKEERLRQMISKDTERLKETSMSEEYRKRLNDVITSRKELQNQLSKENAESQRNARELTTRNTDGSATTTGTTSQLNKTNTDRDEQSSAVVNETSNQVEITQEMLRLKIIDVIARFAGIASEYLNNFDLKRGPDVVFAVDNPLLATVVEKTIQWGQLETPCPDDSLSVPQMLFSDKYEKVFWQEVIETGLLGHLRIILTPIENHTQIEIDFPQFINKKFKKSNNTLVDTVVTLELQGPLENNRPVLMFSDKMFKLIADRDKFCNITTLNLSGLELRGSFAREDIAMSCRSLKSLNLSLCQIESNGVDDNHVSVSSILALFAGSSSIEDAFPELIEFAFRNPVVTNVKNTSQGVIWEVTEHCVAVFEKLRFLDISKCHIEAESVPKIFGFGIESEEGKAGARVGFGETLRTLVLDGCIVDGALNVNLGANEEGGLKKKERGFNSLDSKEFLKLNCFGLKPAANATIVSFWANEAAKRTGRTVHIL